MQWEKEEMGCNKQRNITLGKVEVVGKERGSRNTAVEVGAEGGKGGVVSAIEILQEEEKVKECKEEKEKEKEEVVMVVVSKC